MTYAGYKALLGITQLYSLRQSECSFTTAALLLHWEKENAEFEKGEQTQSKHKGKGIQQRGYAITFQPH